MAILFIQDANLPHLERATVMKKRIRFSVMIVLLVSVSIANAQNVPDPRISDLVQAGKVRIGLFSTQYTKDSATGELSGVRVDIARALAAHIGAQAVLVEEK